LITRKPEEEIPYPVTDGNILDAVIHVYLTHYKAKTPLAVAQTLGIDRRDLGGAIHLLTNMSQEDLYRMLYENQLLRCYYRGMEDFLKIRKKHAIIGVFSL